MTGEATSYQRLREHLGYLGLTTAAENLSPELDRALKDKLSATQVLESLLESEVVATKGAPGTRPAPLRPLPSPQDPG